MEPGPGLAERRSNIAQRAAVVTVLARAAGKTSLFRADDGSVFVYDERRDRKPPMTVRTRITPNGVIGPPVHLYYDP